MNLEKFSERLKRLRDEHDWTQEALAEKLGVKKGAVGNWETGANGAGRDMLRKMAALLGTTELFLSGDSDIQLGAFAEGSAEYSGSLPFSKMTDQELQFIFDSRQKELAEAQEPRRRHELFGLIAEVSSELAKRAMKPGNDPEVSSLSDVDEKVKRAVQETLPKPAPK